MEEKPQTDFRSVIESRRGTLPALEASAALETSGRFFIVKADRIILPRRWAR